MLPLKVIHGLNIHNGERSLTQKRATHIQARSKQDIAISTRISQEKTSTHERMSFIVD